MSGANGVAVGQIVAAKVRSLITGLDTTSLVPSIQLLASLTRIVFSCRVTGYPYRSYLGCAAVRTALLPTASDGPQSTLSVGVTRILTQCTCRKTSYFSYVHACRLLMSHMSVSPWSSPQLHLLSTFQL